MKSVQDREITVLLNLEISTVVDHSLNFTS